MASGVPILFSGSFGFGVPAACIPAIYNILTVFLTAKEIKRCHFLFTVRGGITEMGIAK